MKDSIKEIQINILAVIKTSMSFRNITIEQLSYLTGVKLSILKKMFNYEKEIDFLTMAKIKKALEIRFEVKAV